MNGGLDAASGDKGGDKGGDGGGDGVSAERWRGYPDLYFLGIGGPVDEAGIGHVDHFAWRFLVRTGAHVPEAVLAFSSMPKLMAFTRAVNAATPHAVSTEALKVATRRIAPGLAVAVTLDLAAVDFAGWLGRAALVERVVPELER